MYHASYPIYDNGNAEDVHDTKIANLPDNWHPHQGLTFPMETMQGGELKTFPHYFAYHIFINDLFRGLSGEKSRRQFNHNK